MIYGLNNVSENVLCYQINVLPTLNMMSRSI